MSPKLCLGDIIKCNKYSFARNTFFSNINNNFFFRNYQIEISLYGY